MSQQNVEGVRAALALYQNPEVVAAGDEVVALIRNQRQWGRSTGILTELPPYSMVFGFRDGRVSSWRGYANQEDGLAAVGLRP